jgi:hypothetical protein
MVLIIQLWYDNYSIVTNILVAIELNLEAVQNLLERKKINANRQQKMMQRSFS